MGSKVIDRVVVHNNKTFNLIGLTEEQVRDTLGARYPEVANPSARLVEVDDHLEYFVDFGVKGVQAGPL
jgi:hypothetical protein